MIYALNNINNNPFITLSQAYNSPLHIYIYTYIEIHVYKRTYMHALICTFVCVHICRNVRTYVRACIHACMKARMLRAIRNFDAYSLPPDTLQCIKYTTRNLAWHCYDIALCYRLSKRVLILLSTLSVSRRKYHRLTHCWIKRCHILIALRQYTYIVQIYM